jgi:ribosomal protein L11 methyltransferase
MNNNLLVKYFLKLAKEISPEAQKSDPFGEFAWPKFREGFDEINEKPTSMENKVYKLLKLHFSNKRKGLPKQIAELLSKLVEKEKYKNARSPRTPLYVDPQGSFGSGTHATTRSIIEILEGLKPAPGSFLDVGTGTGILLMAAGKCGIKKLCGTDNDPRALKTARHNLRLNDLRAQLLRADAVTMKKLGSYDVVAANLLSKTLVDSRKTLAGMVRTGGLLIVSGIERRNLRWFLENFKVPGLKRQKIQVRGGWAAVLYLKSKKGKK